LRVFAINPSLETRLDVALMNETTLEVPWEDLAPGPVGEYVEVVDYDPPSRCFYHPVDLNDPYLLVEDGLTPSEASPQFHQQMVYAVAMVTIRNFERALGRRILWAPHVEEHGDRGALREVLVRRLRIYPHALREANAYYSPKKKAMLFGYFPASRDTPGTNMPGGLVFTCLSPEIVAHETAHAVVDGARRLILEPTNLDVLAFHEAFAELVALLQGLTHHEWVGARIARARGDFAEGILFGELVQQSGQAVARYAALREALGELEPETGRWAPKPPDPTAYETEFDPLRRGAILVAAVFDAYLTIYRRRVADLLVIATQGTGILPAGDLPPVLVRNMAGVARRTARHLLDMCIRALDYCPPIDVTFGEFLRALITADRDLVPADDLGYRPAFVEAFRRRGIFPKEVRTLSVESLCWKLPPPDFLDTAALLGRLDLGLGRGFDRSGVAERAEQNRAAAHAWLAETTLPAGADQFLGLTRQHDAPRSIDRDKSGAPAFAVHTVQPAWRVGPDGLFLPQLVLEVGQQRRGYFDLERQRSADTGGDPAPADFTFRGGATLLIDLESGRLRYSVSKSVLDKFRLAQQRTFLSGGHGTGGGGRRRGVPRTAEGRTVRAPASVVLTSSFPKKLHYK